MKTSKLKFEVIFLLLCGIFALFAPVIIKTKTLSYLIVPHALLIVVIGTFCAGCLSFSLQSVMRAFLSLKNLFYKSDKTRLINLADELTYIAKVTRAKGLLALEEYIPSVDNKFLISAIKELSQDPDIRSLEENLRFMSFYENREEFQNIEIFEELGGYAPTFGMLGAVIGLIQLSALSSNPNALLSGISTAFIATVYGLGSANLVFLPLAKRLKNSLDEKLLEQEIIISSILDIANFESSVVVREKLDRMLMENEIKGDKVLHFAA